jgi:hypothetical protein
MTDDYDSPWKDILERYFGEFMAFFFADAYAGIDWSRGYESLDTELQQVVRDAELGKRLADKLMRVWRQDGEEQWVLIHIEIQASYDAGFARRMFIYHYRLFDRYQRTIVSLAVLGDDHPSWRPRQYGTELWGCEILLRFPVVKLTDYNEHWEVLEASVNPFAIMVMAHLKTQATRHDPQARLQWKFQLVKRLYEKGFRREDILELFRFIDWLLVLPQGIDKQFRNELAEYEAAMSTPYITSIERLGIQQGERALLRRQIQHRFGPALAQQLETLLQKIDDPDHLADIGEWVLDYKSGDELLARVRQLVEPD